jgi:hypothetical protein
MNVAVFRPQVGATLLERQAHQRLDAGEVDAAALLCVLGLERELSGRRSHGAPLRDGGC